jgi:hypothetical protein
MCGVGGWDLSPDTRPRSLGDYIQQVDSIWSNALNGVSSKGDESRMAVMDSLRAIEIALTEDGIDPEFKFCKMGKFGLSPQGFQANALLQALVIKSITPNRQSHLTLLRSGTVSYVS